MPIEQFHNLIIGCGVAGKILAWTLAKQGQKTVVVERSMIGGSCVNVGCLPSKNVIYSAKAVSLVHPTTGLGVVIGSGLAAVGPITHVEALNLERLSSRRLCSAGCRTPRCVTLSSPNRRRLKE